jgi:transposase
VVRVPSVEQEDARRLHRERHRLIQERAAHVNRIKGLCATQGIYDYEPLRSDRKAQLEGLRTGDGQHPAGAAEGGDHHIIASSTSKSIGLVTKSSAPSRRALSSTSRFVSAVKKMKGIFPKRGAAAASRLSTSKPDTAGMLISHNTTSGSDFGVGE